MAVPIFYNVFVFVTWTLTSFLCHRFGKAFILTTAGISANEGKPSASHENDILLLISALTLTGIQLLSCHLNLILVKEESSVSKENTARLCHAFATLATNISMALMFASSTFAIKMMEPVTSATVQYLQTGTPMSALAVVSLPVIVGGAITFAGSSLDVSQATLGMLAAFVSNIILAFRNVAFKQMSSNDGPPILKLRHGSGNTLLRISIILLCLSVTFYLENSDILPPTTAKSLLYLCLSGIFHVSYSYVSTALVLTQLSVVSHSVANIMKRLLVVLLLYAFGQRTATTWNVFGLLVSTAGLLIYTWDKSRKQTAKSDKNRNWNKPSKKSENALTFIKYGLLMLGVISTVEIFSHSNHLDIPPMVMRDHTADVEALRKALIKQDAFQQNAFRPHGMDEPNLPDLAPDLDAFPANVSDQLRSFLSLHLSKHPADANFLSRKLTTSEGVVKEAQRLHFTIIGKELEHYKYAILIDFAAFENKGDPCITAGEVYFLARMKIKVIYSCSAPHCRDKKLERAKQLAQKYSADDLVILVHGGGNIVGYAMADVVRFKVIDLFASQFKVFIFPQSIWIRNWKHPHVKRTVNYYCCHPNLTIVLRDLLSYSIAKQLYNGTTRLIMAPDMAFQIGNVPRFMSPVFDIIWIKRKDGETPGYKLPSTVPKNLKVHIADWWKWRTPSAKTSFERAFYIATNGFFFLQRGRVVITDRLHGHILSVLSDIPHVLIDNSAKKLSAYHNTWTKSLSNTVITDDPSEALDLAVQLLKKYGDVLPAKVPFPRLIEDFVLPKVGVPDSAYP